jgi:hypothetical protein
MIAILAPKGPKTGHFGAETTIMTRASAVSAGSVHLITV